MRHNTLLIIIDMQNDFCLPDGALFVNGAEKDITRLGRFISENTAQIDHIVLTQDSHNVVDISHPVFWKDKNGRHPEPFTVISAKSVSDMVWIPCFEREKATEYIKKLEEQGEFPHVIWPEHCIIGSYGAAITDEIMKPVKIWARRGFFFDVITKGTNPLTEHFGALMANIPIDGKPETQLNTGLVNKLSQSDRIIIAGEAKSHCVATTIKQMLNFEGLAKKLIVLQDCMSDVPGFETIAIPIYKQAQEKGVKFALSTDWQ